MEAFVRMYWRNRAAEGELGSNGGLLEYKVRMPSTRSKRLRTDLAIVSIDEPEQNGGGKRSGRVGDRECQTGLGRSHFASVVTGVHFFVVSSGYLPRSRVNKRTDWILIFFPYIPSPTSIFHSGSSTLFPANTPAQLSHTSRTPLRVLLFYLLQLPRRRSRILQPCGSIRNCSRGAC
jgi:hypothetical protein